jgi:DNA polymerase-3 subunit gamma/tau
MVGEERSQVDMELYKKHRPQTLDTVVGNEAVVASLKASLKSNELPHALLLTGPSGTGKTTVARVLAKELKANELDIREMNSSSYRGIDSVRELQSTLPLAPMAGKCRVWIMDEVHKLSNDAQNALLKSLEDTPQHVYLILCTTDPDKLIKAIKTRCTEFRFNALPPEVIGPKLLVPVCKAEGVDVSRDALKRIARECNGSSRMALVMLEKVMRLDKGEQEEALDAAEAEEAETRELCQALLKRASWKEVAAILKRMEKADPENVRRAVLGYMRAVMLNGNGAGYAVAVCLEKNYFDSGNAGLAMSCFEAVSAK